MTKTIAACGAAFILAGVALAAGAQEAGKQVIVRSHSVAAVAGGIADQTRVEAVLTPKLKVPLEAKAVTGAPYSAEVLTENVQVLQDGNRIVNQTRWRVMRDSQGRVRRETERDGQVTSISITDPVAKVTYALDPASRTGWKTAYGVVGVFGAVTGGVGGTAAINYYYSQASAIDSSHVSDPAEVDRLRKLDQEVRKLKEIQEKKRQEAAHAEAAMAVAGPPPPPPPPPPPVLGHESPSHWEEKVEELGPRQIEGVQAAGKRMTRTIAAGAIGNERPIVVVCEEWQSPELQVLVLTTTSDPRVGESVYRLTNIDRSEPAPSLFEVPPDYTIKESGVRKIPAER